MLSRAKVIRPAADEERESRLDRAGVRAGDVVHHRARTWAVVAVVVLVVLVTGGWIMRSRAASVDSRPHVPARGEVRVTALPIGASCATP